MNSSWCTVGLPSGKRLKYCIIHKMFVIHRTECVDSNPTGRNKTFYHCNWELHRTRYNRNSRYGQRYFSNDVVVVAIDSAKNMILRSSNSYVFHRLSLVVIFSLISHQNWWVLATHVERIYFGGCENVAKNSYRNMYMKVRTGRVFRKITLFFLFRRY